MGKEKSTLKKSVRRMWVITIVTCLTCRNQTKIKFLQFITFTQRTLQKKDPIIHGYPMKLQLLKTSNILGAFSPLKGATSHIKNVTNASFG